MLKQIFIVLALLFSTTIVPLAQATTFTVDSTLDEDDATAGDGVCSTASGTCTLRAAVQETESLIGDDNITLPAGTYTLSLTDRLQIWDNLTINGAGMTASIIDGSGVSLGFYGTSNMTLSDLKMINFIYAIRYSYGSGTGSVNLNSVDISGTTDGIIAFSGTGDLIITNSNISNNTGDTGAVGFFSDGNLIISGSTISQNTQSSDSFNNAAGLIIRTGSTSGTAKIYNSTISGNNGVVSQASSSPTAGGIYFDGSTLEIYSSTITENSGNSTGGLYVVSGTAQIQNSIIAGNMGTSGADCYGTLTSNGYNLIGDTYGCTVTASTGDQFGDSSLGTVVDPGLDALANNGGNTQTHGLQTTSPAKNSGDPAGCTDPDGVVLSYDQRGSGYDRISGSACDIGAYELQVPNLPPVSDPGINHTVYTAKPDTTTIRYNLVLDGSHSFDPEGQPLTYSWSVVSVPRGSAVTTANIADPTLESTSATLDHAGVYVFRLVVTDDQGQTDTATVRIRLIVL